MAPLWKSRTAAVPSSEVTSGAAGAGHGPVFVKGPDQGRDALDLADQEAALVDGVAADALQSARGGPGREPDLVGRQRRIVAGHLQIMDANLVERAQPAAVDQVLGQPHGGHEAVVEGAHRLAAGGCGRVAHPPRILHPDGHRLLADHVLAVLERSNARIGVDRVRPAIVEDVDLSVGRQFPPVAAIPLEAVAGRLALDDPCVLVAKHGQPRHETGRGIDVRHRLVRVAVAAAHESAPQHPNSNFFRPGNVDRLDRHR